MEKDVIVLGAGLVGSAIAIDLKKSGLNVGVVDIDSKKLKDLQQKHQLTPYKCDFSDRNSLTKIIESTDIVVGAVPGSLGIKILQLAIECKKDIVDISFCPENYLELDTLAKQNGVTAIVDMGVAPGMCNAILGFYNTQMQVNSYKCIVGGLPVKREWPFEYKATWSPIDIIEEYTRPARFVQNGELVVKPALSDLEMVNFTSIGTLEEWNSDGLRSLLYTMPDIPNMIEKTLRYPGTMNYMKMLRESGFFSDKEIQVKGVGIKPIDLTSTLLFSKWKLDKDEDEFTVMRITIEGIKEDTSSTIVYELYDKYDYESETTSMARTTGYTCTGAVHLVLEGLYKNPGINPPEFIGANKACFEFLLKHLNERNITYKASFS